MPCSKSPISTSLISNTSAIFINWMNVVVCVLTRISIFIVLVSVMLERFQVLEWLTLRGALVSSHGNLEKCGRVHTCYVVQNKLTRCKGKNQFCHGQTRRVCVIFDVHHMVYAAFCIVDFSPFDWITLSTVQSSDGLCTYTLRIRLGTAFLSEVFKRCVWMVCPPKPRRLSIRSCLFLTNITLRNFSL